MGHLWYQIWPSNGLQSQPSQGRPSTSTTTDQTIKAVKKMILNNRRIAIRETVDDLGISFGSGQPIFTNFLDIKRAAAKIVPKLRNFDPKQRHMNVSQEMLKTITI